MPPRPPHRLPRPARLALGAVKASLVGSIVVAGLAAQPAPPAPADPGPGYAGFPVDDAPSRQQRLLDVHDCSTTGFDDADPASAIIRTARGRLRHVSFATGWDVYTRHGAATLVAVCLGPAPAE